MNTSTKPYIEKCPVGCAASFEPTDILVSEGALLRCTACGQLVSQCTGERYQQSMKEFNAPRGTWPTGGAARRLLQQSGRILNKIEKILNMDRRAIRLLDIGCSSGAFVDAVRKNGGTAEGVEPAAEPVETARAAGLTVHQGFLEDVGFADGSFDALTLFEVIEHLRQPLQLLDECHRILKPGGCLVLRTGNTASWTVRFMKGRWFYFSIAMHGGHVSFYNPYSMRLVAQRSGFEVADMHTHSVGFYEKGEIAYPLYRLAKLASELCAAPAKFFNRGHEMIVYLRKI